MVDGDVVLNTLQALRELFSSSIPPIDTVAKHTCCLCNKNRVKPYQFIGISRELTLYFELIQASNPQEDRGRETNCHIQLEASAARIIPLHVN
jgi:hypothetical protein